MVRPPYFDSNGMKKGAWSEEEDNKLRDYIQSCGHVPNWRWLPIYAGLARCGKSCRLRWVNYLKPGLKRGNLTKDEKDLIIKLHAQLGNKWSAIARHFPGRTDNEIKNFWHAHIQKRSKQKRDASKRVIKTEMRKKELSYSSKRVIMAEMQKEELSYSEINFCNINQTETPSNNGNPQGLFVENLENINRCNNVMTEDCQTCYNLRSPFAEGELIDNFWSCEEMQKNNMSLFFESSDGGYSNAESQLEDFWAETLGEEAISWYFGDIMNMLQA